MTNHSRVPSSLWEITSDRIASSLARPPALRMTCASPSARPAYFAGSSRASMHVKIAKWRAGGMASFPLSPKLAAYLAFAARTSSNSLLMSPLPCIILITLQHRFDDYPFHRVPADLHGHYQQPTSNH